jgi:hypothetical protein
MEFNNSMGDNVLIMYGPGATCTAASPNCAAFFMSEYAFSCQNVGAEDPSHGVAADAREASGQSR